jgi:3'-phosphoadenosine 5'-phosphosulfate sulfotransferase (PAPS reductase)/FAD synthetase
VIKERIIKALEGAGNPIIFCSFGKDSMLLLKIAREVKPDIPCLWFRHDLLPTQKEFAERIICDWNLTVFGYPPAQTFVLPNDEMTFISDQSINGYAWPVLVDQVYSDRCSLELDKTRMAYFPFGWDVVLTGWKSSDTHPLIPEGSLNIDGLKLGDVTFYSPLHDLTDGDVWTLIKELNVPVDEKRYAGDDLYNPDVVHACVACLKPDAKRVWCPSAKRLIDAHTWNHKAETANFQARFA